MVKFPAVIVNASNPMALHVIRTLGKRGIPIHAVFGKSKFPGSYFYAIKSSRFISWRYYFTTENYEANLIACLMRIGRNLNLKAVLFPATDMDMIVISRHRRLLEEYYFLFMPPHSIIQKLSDKNQFYKFAKDKKLSVPNTYYPHGLKDIDRIVSSIKYPCILKPSSSEGVRLQNQLDI
jgi:D-aspartate ligase